MFFVQLRAWDKGKILISHEEFNLRPSDSALWCSTTEPQRLYGERGLLRSSYMTRILHTARISDVGSVMFVNRIRKIVSSELGKEKREICSSFCHERGTKSCFFFLYSFLKVWCHSWRQLPCPCFVSAAYSSRLFSIYLKLSSNVVTYSWLYFDLNFTYAHFCIDPILRVSDS